VRQHDGMRLLSEIEGEHFERIPNDPPDLYQRDHGISDQHDDEFSQPADVRAHDQTEKKGQAVTEDQWIDDESEGVRRSIPESELDLCLNLVEEVLIRLDNDPLKNVPQDVAQNRFRRQAGRCAVKG
jgi:hypothetical protein